MSHSDADCPGGCKGYGGWWTSDSDPAYILCKVCKPSYNDLLNAYRLMEAGDHSKSAWDFRVEREAREAKTGDLHPAIACVLWGLVSRFASGPVTPDDYAAVEAALAEIMKRIGHTE